MKTKPISRQLIAVGLCLSFFMPLKREAAAQDSGGTKEPDPSEQGRALIQDANRKIWKARAADDDKMQARLFGEAQTQLTKARGAFQTAHDQSKAAYDAFPKFIPQDDDDYINRQEAEIAYMRAQIDLAICTYTEAQTYSKDSKNFKDRLGTAADEFKTIHEKYRSMVAGLYARMWQGKCYEEQNEIGKALGIYNELLAHPGQNSALKNVQDQTRLFRLYCLNTDSRKDFQLVINEAGEWMSGHEKQNETTTYLGIQFQKAIAHEKLADQLAEKNAADAKRHRQSALKDAGQVAKFSGSDQAAAKAMIKRLNQKLGN